MGDKKKGGNYILADSFVGFHYNKLTIVLSVNKYIITLNYLKDKLVPFKRTFVIKILIILAFSNLNLSYFLLNNPIVKNLF